MSELKINDSAKTYKTKENLEKAIEKLGLPQDIRWIHVIKDDGRHTAVFIYTLNSKSPGMSHYLAAKGFLTVC